MGQKKSIDLIRGEQDFVMSHEIPDDEEQTVEDDRVLKLMNITYNSSNSTPFFTEKEMVSRIGIISVILCRMGYDNATKNFKFYMRKENINSKPSIVYILHREMAEVLEQLKSALKAIEEGFTAGNPKFSYLRDSEDSKASNREFWWHPDIIMSLTGTFRMRIIHRIGKFYNFYINNPSDNSQFDGYFGPRISLTCPEVQQLIELLEENIEKNSFLNDIKI